MSSERPVTSYGPHLWMTALVAIWAGSIVVAKEGMKHLSPFALVASRFLIGALCILPFFLRTNAEQRRGTLVPGVIAGLVLAAPYFLQMYGVRETTASMGGFLNGLIVLLVAVGGHLFFGARIGMRTIAGLLLGLGGIVTLCLTGDDDPEGPQHNTLRGILLQIGAAVGYATHVLLLSHFGRKLAVAPFTFCQLGVTALLATTATFLFSGLPADGQTSVTWSFELLLIVAYLGVLATGAAIGIQSNVQHRIPSTHVALLFALQPLFAAIFGGLFHGDLLGPWQWTGGGLIVAGVVVTAFDRP